MVDKLFKKLKIKIIVKNVHFMNCVWFSDFYEEYTQNALNDAHKEAVTQTLEEISREETR